MLGERRRSEIIRLLRVDGIVTVGDVAGQLGVSDATVRRDLAQLHADGQLTRVHGGAVGTDGEPPFDEAATAHLDAADAVARRAADLVEDGEVLMLDIGTTVHRLARRLHGRPVTVITSNLAVYEELARDEAVRLLLLGGEVRRNYRSLVGFLTEGALRQVHADRLFLGTSGVRRTGQVMDTTVVEVPSKRAMIASSDRVVLMATAEKFPGTGLAVVCEADRLDVVVTEESADPQTVTALRGAGVEVVYTCGS